MKYWIFACRLGEVEEAALQGCIEKARSTILHYVMQQCFRAGNRVSGPDSNRENIKIGPPAGLGGPILKLSRLVSGRNPARKPNFRAGSTIA
jgi:hypothetical protein